jgi:hypothetical protein
MAVSAAVMSLALSLGGRSVAAPAKGQPAPGFIAETLAGKRISLAGYRGKSAVILNFFASW